MLLVHVESCLGRLCEQNGWVSPLSGRKPNSNHAETCEPLGAIFNAIDTNELFIFLEELFCCIEIEAKAFWVIGCDQVALIIKEANRRQLVLGILAHFYASDTLLWWKIYPTLILMARALASNVGRLVAVVIDAGHSADWLVLNIERHEVERA